MTPARSQPLHGAGLVRRAVGAFLCIAVGLIPFPSAAQVETEVPPVIADAKRVVIERVKVHSPAIEGNLEGDTADRDVIVVLPPSYRADPSRRRFGVDRDATRQTHLGCRSDSSCKPQ